MSNTEAVDVAALVDTALKSVGLDPATCSRPATDKGQTWAFRRGSVDVVVSLVRDAKGDWLRVAAPVLVPPEATDKRQALYEHLLELNGQGLFNAAFGLLDGRVIAVSERPVADLDASEVEQMIKHLSAVADTYDDRLASQFGGRRASD